MLLIIDLISLSMHFLSAFRSIAWQHMQRIVVVWGVFLHLQVMFCLELFSLNRKAAERICPRAKHLKIKPFF